MAFDISNLSIQDSTVLHLLHPATGEKLYANEKEQKDPITITVYSTSSRAYRTAVNAMQNRTLKLGKKVRTPEQSREEGLALLVACCADSTNLTYKGNSVKSESDFRALLEDDKMAWIKTQVDEALGNVENFIA